MEVRNHLRKESQIIEENMDFICQKKNNLSDLKPDRLQHGVIKSRIDEKVNTNIQRAVPAYIKPNDHTSVVRSYIVDEHVRITNETV